MEIKNLKVGELQTNCYLVISGKELAVIDPGGEGDRIFREIEKSGTKTKYIINTHEHSDHISANKELKEKTGAKILNGLKDGDKIKIGEEFLRVIHTPGHTKESVCLIGEGFIFTGDTLFKDGYGRTDLPGGSEKELRESLKRLFKVLKTGIMVYPGHGPFFKIKP